MEQPFAPGFQLGDRAFLSDGRSGLVTASRFNEAIGVWEHLLDPLFEFFSELDLSREPPIVEEEFEAPPPVAVVLPPEVIPEPTGATAADLEAAITTAVERANLIAQGNLLTHIADVESRAADVELFSRAQFSELESMVTTALSEISNRAQELDTAAEESSGTGFFGFVGGLGGLIRNPVDWIMSRLGDHIASEVNDGLNR